MSADISKTTWMENPKNVIMLVNQSANNYTLELPSGRYRLDAGRRMRTTRDIMKVTAVKALVDDGQLAVE